MKKYLATLGIILLSSICYAQGSGTPDQLRVKTDANGYLLVVGATQTAPISQPTVFSNTRLQTDANGNLLVIITGGPISGQINPDSICLDSTNKDTCLVRDAANTLAQRNGTNAQIFNIYNTFTNSSNYERGFLKWSSNNFRIGMENLGSGSSRDVFIDGGTSIRFTVGGSETWRMSPNFIATTDNNADIGASGANRPRNLYLASKITQYNSITTAGWGAASIYGFATTGTVTNSGTASIATYTVGAADGVFDVGCGVNITVSTTHSFSCDVTYTDVSNVARTMTLQMTQNGGTAFIASGLMTNTTGVGDYESAHIHLRVKASTAIVVRTSSGGTFTTVTYTANGSIVQIG